MSGVIFLLADHLLSLTAVKQKVPRKSITRISSRCSQFMAMMIITKIPYVCISYQCIVHATLEYSFSTLLY